MLLPRSLASLLLLALIAAAALLSPQAARAQGQQHIAAALTAESGQPAPGASTTLALAMTPQPGWHGYWVNGGEAGFGMTVDWSLPDGVTVSPLRYPVPLPLTLLGMMNHAYEKPYALLADVRVAPDVPPGADISISGTARWLACSDTVCVPEQAVVAVRLRAGDGGVTAGDRARFDAWRAALPQPIDRSGRWERRGGQVHMALPIPATLALTQPHLFVETRDLVDYAAPQHFRRSGDLLLLSLPADGPTAADAPVDVLLATRPGKGLSLRLMPGSVPSGGTPIAGAVGVTRDGSAFWLALGGALIGGLLLNIMPCVFPILSLKALSLARAGGDERAARSEAIAYTLGATLTALLLGAALLALRAAGEQIGWAFQLQHPTSVLILLILAAAITLNLLGVFELPGFGGGQRLAGQGGVAGGFWTGALAAFVATPCSGPLLGAALGATLVLPYGAALAIFAGLGLGLALPFLAIGFIPALRRRLPPPGPWMARFRRWMALPMAVTALALMWLLWRQTGTIGLAIGSAAIAFMALGLAVLGRRQDAGRPATTMAVALIAVAMLGTVAAHPSLRQASGSASATAGGAAWSPKSLASARASGRPVFVNFTADWCLTCKANEVAAIDRAEVRAAFAKANVAVLVADWTNGDPAITRALAAHGRNSVPLYLWYAPGTEHPEILPQILTPSLLIARAR